MKPAILAVALMLGGGAIAQTTTPQTTSSHDATHAPTGTMTDHRGMDHATTTPAPTTMTTAPAAPASGPVVSAGNENPKRDARGIKVLSDPAVVPAGFNGVSSGGGMGGPLVDPATGETVDANAPTAAPPCTAEITDSCLQTYERGRRPQ